MVAGGTAGGVGGATHGTSDGRPKAGGGWQVTGDDQTFRTQAEAERAARRQLTSSGGGELVVKGRDGRIRLQNTIGRPDPRRSKG